MSRILLVGGGGFAKEVHEIADLNGHDVMGYVADSEGVVDLPYLGSVDSISVLQPKFDHIVIGFGAVDRRSLDRRAQTIAQIGRLGVTSIQLVSPHATISRGAVVAPGAVVAHGAVVSVDARIGSFAILNSSAVVGHDAIIGERSIVAPCAFVGGAAKIGPDSLLGPNSVVLEGRHVGARVIVSVGSLVLRDVAEDMTVLPKRSQARR
jgi:acetyltransferase EpsM